MGIDALRIHRMICGVGVSLLCNILLVVLIPCVTIAGGAAGSVNYISWKVTDSSGERTVDQVASSFNGSITLHNNFDLLIAASGARTNLETSFLDTDLTGVGDVRLHLNRSFKDGHVLFGLGVNIPTGKIKLDVAKDTSVINQLAKNFLIFPMRAYGRGPGVLAFAGVTENFGGSHQASLNVIYEYLGTFEPYQGLGDYDPGNQFTVGVGSDFYFDFLTVSVDANISVYGADVLNDKKVFEQSARVSGDVSGRYDFEPSRFDFAFGYLYRGRNAIYDGNETVFQQLRLFGHELFAQAGISRAFGESVRAGANSEVRLITADENIGSSKLGKSNTIGFGGDVTALIGNGFSASSAAKYYTGSANDGAIDLSGIMFRLGITRRF